MSLVAVQHFHRQKRNIDEEKKLRVYQFTGEEVKFINIRWLAPDKKASEHINIRLMVAPPEMVVTDYEISGNSEENGEDLSILSFLT